MIDEKCGAQVAITGMNHAIHEGNAYTCCLTTAKDAFDTGSPMSFFLTTPDTAVHAHIQIHGSANLAAVLEIFEDNSVVAQFNVSGGTAVTPVNKDRNSSNASTMTVKHTPTIGAATVEARIHGRFAGKAGSHPSFEFVLKGNTKYLFKFTSLDEDNEGSLNIDWCERADKSFVGSVGPVGG